MRLIVYSNESHLEGDPTTALAVGDKFDAIRGNGPREGRRMGSATVTGFDADGNPTIELHIEGEPGK